MQAFYYSVSFLGPTFLALLIVNAGKHGLLKISHLFQFLMVGQLFFYQLFCQIMMKNKLILVIYYFSSNCVITVCKIAVNRHIRYASFANVSLMTYLFEALEFSKLFYDESSLSLMQWICC